MNGEAILKQIERGLADAGIVGRVMDVNLETRRMPITLAQSGPMIVDQVVLGYTMKIEIDVQAVNIVKAGSGFRSTEFGPPVRSIARAGEEV